MVGEILSFLRCRNSFERPSGFFLFILPKFREKSKKATTFGMTKFRQRLYINTEVIFFNSIGTHPEPNG